MAHYKKIEHPIPTLTSGTWEEFQKFETTFTENHKVKPKAEDIKHFLGWSDKDVDACEKYIHRLQLKPDQYFPHFIANGLPPGLTGLVIAAMFAAAMSSLDSGVNSITAVVSTDFIERNRKEKLSEKQQLLTARFIAVVVGVVVILGSVLTEFIQGNIMEVTASAVNLLTTPIFGLFIYALYFKNLIELLSRLPLPLGFLPLSSSHLAMKLKFTILASSGLDHSHWQPTLPLVVSSTSYLTPVLGSRLPSTEKLISCRKF